MAAIPREFTPTSHRVRARLVRDKRPFAANDNIADAFAPGELADLQLEVAARVEDLLQSLVIDTARDHNTRGTADRVAKMLIREVMRGRYEQPPAATDFPNARRVDELCMVGPVTVRSMCSHHLVPIIGRAWVGVIPKPRGRVIGLSKFHRLAEFVMARPQIQEEATAQLADLLEDKIKPAGLALVVRAGHLCTTWRGVRDDATEMVTSVMRGAFRRDARARAEFLALIR